MLFSWKTCLAHQYHPISLPSTQLPVSPFLVFSLTQWKPLIVHFPGVFNEIIEEFVRPRPYKGCQICMSFFFFVCVLLKRATS